MSSVAICRRLAELDESRAQGCDEIHPRILKNFAAALSVPLSLLFKQTLEVGEVPEAWRMANFSPIFKKGSEQLASNYRPVSLTPVPCKILEHIIKETIVEHCTMHELIKDKQHGFVSKKSCVTNLLEALDIMTQATLDGYPVDSILTDFEKALDKVAHRRLLLKLQTVSAGRS